MKTTLKISAQLSAKITNLGFICALLVVILHSVSTHETGTFWWWISGCIGDDGLSAVAVPFFFVISGFLFAGRVGEAGWWRRQVVSRFKSILVPYLIWNLLGWCFVLALGWIAFSVGHPFHGVDLHDYSVSKILSVIGANPLFFSHIVFLWFLRTLFVLVLVSGFIVLLLRYCGGRLVVALYVLMFIAMSAWTLPTKGWEPYLISQDWIRGVFWFTLGLYLRLYDRVDVIVPQERRKDLFWFFLGMLITVFSLWAKCEGCGRVQMALHTLSLPMLMKGIWAFVPEASWPKWLTAQSFPIYLLQYFCFMSLTALTSVSGIKWNAFERGSITIICSIVAGLLLRRWMPGFSRIAFGNRG